MKMSDLARIAGVSKSTVSRALAGSERVTKKTRERIQQLAREHNYRMDMRARNFRLKQTRTIGVLLPSNGRPDWLASDPFMLELLGTISDALEQKGGHELLLSKHSNDDPSWIEEFARHRTVDGIIVVGQSLYHNALNKVAEWQQAMVVWGAEMPDQHYYTVGSDNVLGGKLATEHLLDQGRKNFAFLGDTRYPETKQRYQGYKEALVNAGVDYKSKVTTSEGSSNLTSDVISTLLESGQPVDALVAASDMLAISAIKSISNFGLSVPNDIAVVGYDNISLSRHCNPALSSITQDRRLAGRLLVDKLFELIETGETSNETISTALIARESSAH